MTALIIEEQEMRIHQDEYAARDVISLISDSLVACFGKAHNLL